MDALSLHECLICVCAKNIHPLRLQHESLFSLTSAIYLSLNVNEWAYFQLELNEHRYYEPRERCLKMCY